MAFCSESFYWGASFRLPSKYPNHKDGKCDNLVPILDASSEQIYQLFLRKNRFHNGQTKVNEHANIQTRQSIGKKFIR